MKQAMIINYEYCSGCRSCEISCRNEKELSLKEWGIKVTELGPVKFGDEWQWDYLPAPSHLCDMCVERREAGKVAPCQLHCLANVIEIMPLDEAAKRMEELDGKTTCYVL